jgi:hypothetical protein
LYLVRLNKLPERIFSSAVDPLSAQLDPVAVDRHGVDPAADPVQGLQDDDITHAKPAELGSVLQNFIYLFLIIFIILNLSIYYSQVHPMSMHTY